MKLRLRLDFIHRNDDDLFDTNDDDDGPLRLIRPMPERLRDYVSTNAYDDFCIHSVDPLLVELHKVEKSMRRRRSVLGKVAFVLYSGIIAATFLVQQELLMYVMYSALGITFIFGIIALFVNNGNDSSLGRELNEAIRCECQGMSNRCNFQYRAANQNIQISFELFPNDVLHNVYGDTYDNHDLGVRYIIVHISDNTIVSTDDSGQDKP